MLSGSHVFILSPANGWETGLWSIVLAFLTSEKVFVFLGNCMVLFCSKEIVLIEFFYIPFLYWNFIVKLTSVLVAVLLNLFCPILGSLYVYEQGFVFVHPRFGVISLPISKFSRVQFYDKVPVFQKSIFLTGNPFY